MNEEELAEEPAGDGAAWAAVPTHGLWRQVLGASERAKPHPVGWDPYPGVGRRLSRQPGGEQQHSDTAPGGSGSFGVVCGRWILLGQQQIALGWELEVDAVCGRLCPVGCGLRV